MFTGLIEDVGVVESVARLAQAATFDLRTPLAAELRDGDSLAVNGVCLTVVSGDGPQRVRATAVAETLERTTLAALAPGAAVHLERALRAGDPMGGHIVQGHVDGVGRVSAVVRRGLSLELGVTLEAKLLRYLVEKGSVAVDGASLTVARLEREAAFTVALVPHTLEHTRFGAARVGQAVNVEVDILAKYVERMLASRGGDEEPRLSAAWLKERGF